MWKCSNTCSLPILISRAAYPYFLINTLLTTLLFDYLDTLRILSAFGENTLEDLIPRKGGLK